jgi:SAM-dependent methyltransferase
MLNTAGWISSCTGELLSEADMREWVSHTVGRILAHRPRRVLEIGCGTGMLLFRIAPDCERYFAVDVSDHAIRYVQAEVDRQVLRNVTLRRASASELTGLEERAFDSVVLNSVIQYFPSAAYLVEVLERIVPLVEEGGTIFIGDVRSLPLHEVFCTWVELQQAPENMSADELRQRIRKRMERETELLIDPNLFHALPRHLPRIRGVQVQLKRGQSHNEVTCFRYDVILRIGGSPSPAPPAAFEAGDAMSLAGIRRRLSDAERVVAIAGVANARVARAARAKELLTAEHSPETAGSIRRMLAEVAACGTNPEDLFSLESPYEVQIGWSPTAVDRFDVVFQRRDAPVAVVANCSHSPLTGEAWEQWANQRAAPSNGSDLPGELKEMLKARLPEYMVPATIVVLGSLPRTPNGKIDRQALPEPDLQLPARSDAYCPPETDLEKDIAVIWQELLRVERVGVLHNFFDLGANSLLMVQATSRLRAALRRDVSLIDLFQYPTVKALAAHLGHGNNVSVVLEKSQERGLARGEALRRRKTARIGVSSTLVPPVGKP